MFFRLQNLHFLRTEKGQKQSSCFSESFSLDLMELWLPLAILPAVELNKNRLGHGKMALLFKTVKGRTLAKLLIEKLERWDMEL